MAVTMHACKIVGLGGMQANFTTGCAGLCVCVVYRQDAPAARYSCSILNDFSFASLAGGKPWNLSGCMRLYSSRN